MTLPFGLPVMVLKPLAGDVRLGDRLAVHLGELGLVVEQLDVRRAAVLEQVDDALGLGGEVRQAGQAAEEAGLTACVDATAGLAGPGGRLGGQAVAGQQGTPARPCRRRSRCGRTTPGG